MTNRLAFQFDDDTLAMLGNDFIALIGEVYRPERPMPEELPPLPAIPAMGAGARALPELWRTLSKGAARLGSPYMSGHMDTAPHPFAVMTQAVAAALNNNMLFRELSPVGSAIEEQLIDDFIVRLGLCADWVGTWASGGSIANLTCLFCAVGGFEDTTLRENAYLLLPESGHSSLRKSATVLGLSQAQVIGISCDDAGRIEIDALRKTLALLPASAKPVVTSVLGTTIHGSVDNIPEVASLCRERDAWHHVDAMYAGALMFSHHNRHLLRGLDLADSIVLGPQKWMYVPRVSASLLIREHDLFDRRLGMSIPYSISGEQHRGTWGLQGSRPADATVLWALLQSIGTDAIGETIDHGIEMARKFHELLSGCTGVSAAHHPDLNLQVIRTLDPAAGVQRKLIDAGGLWTSLSQWRGEQFLRTVLLSPSLDEDYLAKFCISLERATR